MNWVIFNTRGEYRGVVNAATAREALTEHATTENGGTAPKLLTFFGSAADGVVAQLTGGRRGGVWTESWMAVQESE